MISYIIRTLNEERLIGRLIETLQAQSSGDTPEIIIVDSGSTDATIEITKTYKVKLIQIKKEEFNYSCALNLGIEQGSGDIIAILSGHSIPSENGWLEKMVSHFKDDSTAGVFCKQIPWPDADPYESLRLEKMFGDISMIYDCGNSDMDIPFSNAASCIRRSLWERHPFEIMPAAEDREWAAWAVKQGYKIIYDSAARVYHSHTEPCRKAAERIIQIERTIDIKKGRKRNRILTIKQSLGRFIRDLKKIPVMKESGYEKFLLLKDCAARAFWYAYDFDRKKQ